MRRLPDASVDACITDPPYGTTACSWDNPIPFAPMWAELKRIVKRKGAIVLFGSQPFTSALVMSNPQMFKYEWAWDKKICTGHANAFIAPLRAHESVCVFYAEQCTYNPQTRLRTEKELSRFSYNSVQTKGSQHTGKMQIETGNRFKNLLRYPDSLLRFTGVVGRSTEKQDGGHPTQKPVELMRYLTRTYTNAGETILDFTCGSGSTGVAAAIEGRNFIGIDSDEIYCAIARARIQRAQGIAVDIPRRLRSDKVLPLFQEASA